jgi:hypothetical protein
MVSVAWSEGDEVRSELSEIVAMLESDSVEELEGCNVRVTDTVGEKDLLGLMLIVFSRDEVNEALQDPDGDIDVDIDEVGVFDATVIVSTAVRVCFVGVKVKLTLAVAVIDGL